MADPTEISLRRRLRTSLLTWAVFASALLVVLALTGVLPAAFR